MHLEVIKNLRKLKLEELISHESLIEKYSNFGALMRFAGFTVPNDRPLWRKTSKYCSTPAFRKLVSRERDENDISHICFSKLPEDDNVPLTDSRYSFVSGVERHIMSTVNSTPVYLIIFVWMEASAVRMGWVATGSKWDLFITTLKVAKLKMGTSSNWWHVLHP